MRERFRSAARRLGLLSSANFRETGMSWSEAQASVSSYANPDILSQVREALGKVRDGEAEYERDGVNFPEVEYSWPVLSALLLAAAQDNGALRVVDFGGSLGTTYFQNRNYLRRLNQVVWQVVEQPNFVEVGKAEFENSQLSFSTILRQSLDEVEPHVVLLSSSLQYVEDPDDALRQAFSSSASHLIIDRTPFHAGEKHLLTIQTVPPSVYPAQYPAWILSRRQLGEIIPKGWQKVSEFHALGGEDITQNLRRFCWSGMWFTKEINEWKH